MDTIKLVTEEISNTDLFIAQLREELNEKYHVMLSSKAVRLYIRKVLGISDSADRQSVTIDTMRQNIVRIYEFCQSQDRSPDELIEAVVAAKKKSNRPMKYEEILEEYYQVLRDKDQKVGTVRNKCSTISAFIKKNLRQYGLEFNYELPKLTVGDEDIGYRPTLKELRYIFASADDLQVRRFILFASQTGLSETDILNLDAHRFNHRENSGPMLFDSIAEQCARKEPHIAIVIPRQKTKVRALTYLGPECVRMTDFSLDEGKLFTYGGKHATRRVRDDIHKLAEKVGIPDLSPHAFRRFFESQLTNAGLNENVISTMMGHSIPHRVTRHYLIPRQQYDYRRIYKSAYELLRILPAEMIDKLPTITPEEISKVPLPEE
ncbi:MAG: tyrosine-type recombinase/integrase [Thaumarchaeota archaeon]|nr:tyrosine-type recombinase/integrase [Nitrososphaerota archaeon]